VTDVFAKNTVLSAEAAAKIAQAALQFNPDAGNVPDY